MNTDKIKTGEIQEGAEVVRDLMRMKKEKALNTSEKNCWMMHISFWLVN